MYDALQEDRSSPIDLQSARRLVEAISRPWPDLSDGSDSTDLPQISDYMIDRQLGTGGGGTVYHAVLPGWNDEFAIKWLHKPAADERVASRAWRELDLAERLDLPGTPRVFEYGVHEGRIFIVSEMILGQPLDQYCRERGLSIRERVGLLTRVCRALHELHERGVIHRDIKPSNVLVKPDGNPVVIDLGISALIDDDRADTLTMTGAAIGTVAFMAPEQARGETGATSIRTDVYSLGATACAILTGTTPHDVAGLSVLEAIRRVGHEAPRSPAALDPKLPPDLGAALGRAVDPIAENRFRSVAEFGDELQCWLDGRPGSVRPRRWTRTLSCAIRRHPARWAWGAAACLAVMGSAAFAGGAEWRRIDERLELLAELEAKQTRIDEQLKIYENAFIDMNETVDGAEFKEAQRFLALLGANVRAGRAFGREEFVDEFENAKGSLIAAVLRAVHAGDVKPPTRSELALDAVRSLYQHDGLWDEQRAATIEDAIHAIE